MSSGFRDKIKTDSLIQKALHTIPKVRDCVITSPDLEYEFIPASNDFFKEQFYWDSYFIMLGLIISGMQGTDICKKMLANFKSLFEHHGYIPNSSSSFVTRSQPPFLTSMIMLVYEKDLDSDWLEDYYQLASSEYLDFWTAPDKLHLHKETGLSFYNDFKDPNNGTLGNWYGAEQESGWDNTSRFQRKTDRVLPVDLNSLLYKYEIDLSQMAMILKRIREAAVWKEHAIARKQEINELMWDKEDGFFFDYNFVAKEKLKTYSLAGFYPLWVKLANASQARSVKSKLPLFEREFGVAATSEQLADRESQWSFPNGWPPLTWIVFEGLKNYDFSEDAERIAYKWLKNSAQHRVSIGDWAEKLSVVNGASQTDDPRYAHQKHQYWSMYVFSALYNSLMG